VQDLIKTKKGRIKQRLEDIIKRGPQATYTALAEELCAAHTPASALAALLEYAFQDEFDAAKYTEVETAVPDKKGTTRLFVRRGKKHGLTNGKLIALIKEICAVPSGKIHDMHIADTCAFVSLPFHDAEKVLAYFRKAGRGGAPLITKSKQGGPKK